MSLYHVVQGNSLNLLKRLKSESIDCVVTSPPYWQMRDYEVDGQLGLEKDFYDYVNKLLLIFDEVKRVLKSTGTLWVNLGDSYSRSGGGGKSQYTGSDGIKKKNKHSAVTIPHKAENLSSKCLVQIPFRFSIGMVEHGWILRNTIIWHKPNAMPSPVKDRFTVDFEYVFFFVKSKKYYFKQILEPYDKPLNRWAGNKMKPNIESSWDKGVGQKSYRNRNIRPNPKGRNKRTVWSINTKPYKGAHFAVFPETLVEPIIEAGCPKDGIVLDPFCGSGTTLMVAQKKGIKSIGFEINKNYCELALKRLKNI